ncbi:MAG TPA: AtpZ/AtpI family protein [Limnochordales bacterium]
MSSWVLGTAGVLVLGIWGGSAADRRFGTAPWLTLAGTLLAVLWAMGSLVREVLRLQDRRRR